VVDEAAGEASVHHLERLLTEDAYARECQRAARKLAERRYSLRPMLAAYEDIYRELAAARFQLAAGHSLAAPPEVQTRERPINS
jgi:DNA-binding SARP family transcriptional activator